MASALAETNGEALSKHFIFRLVLPLDSQNRACLALRPSLLQGKAQTFVSPMLLGLQMAL